jgi:hypothetical protein
VVFVPQDATVVLASHDGGEVVIPVATELVLERLQVDARPHDAKEYGEALRARLEDAVREIRGTESGLAGGSNPVGLMHRYPNPQGVLLALATMVIGTSLWVVRRLRRP